jgi:signal transduction histidine kinase
MSQNDELRTLNRELMQKNLQLSRALAEQEKLRSRLVENEKLAALGQLVAGFAHELNTPIGIAVTAATTLEDRVKRLLSLLEQPEIDEAVVQELTGDIRTVTQLCISNLRRASGLVTSFKRVSVDQIAEHRERFSIGTLLQDTAATLRPMLKHEGIKLEVQIEEDAEICNAPGALSQVITNIVLNAAKHGYPPDLKRADKRIVVDAWKDLDAYYVIEVKDFGKGIAPEQRSKLFVPFETTARGRGGTGLGLTIANNIVTGLFGGSITVDSEPGKGASFFLRLPLGEREAPT